MNNKRQADSNCGRFGKPHSGLLRFLFHFLVSVLIGVESEDLLFRGVHHHVGPGVAQQVGVAEGPPLAPEIERFACLANRKLLINWSFRPYRPENAA